MSTAWGRRSLRHASALLAFAAAPSLAASPAAPLPAWVEEDHVCVQVGLPVKEGAALDLGKPLSPEYRVGARLSGQSCEQTRTHVARAGDVPALVAALRGLGARIEAGANGDDALANCAASGGSITFSKKEPRVSAAGLEFWIFACGETHHFLASLQAGPQGPVIGQIQVVPEQTSDEATEALVTDTLAGPRWKPDKLRVDAAISRESDGDESEEDELSVKIEGTWNRGANVTTFTLDNDYESVDGTVRDRESSVRLRWIHDYEPGWFVMAQTYAERNEVELLDEDYDYLLLQAAGGGGYRWRWNNRAMLRAALLWNEFDITLLEPDVGLREHAPSLYLAANWKLSERLSFEGWSEFYYWSRGDIGSDIDLDLLYDLTRNLGFGLRWTYTRDAASLDRTNEDEIRLFLRYRF